MSARHTRRDFLAAAQHMAAASSTASRLLAAGVTAGPPPATEASGGDGPNRSWYRIVNAASGDDEPEMLIYDEIGGWYGSTADDFIADLRGITAPNLKLRINSPGGSVFEGIAIANAIRNHPANVTVQVDGIAASIASVIAMAGDRLVMMPQSTLMIHDASGLCMGNAAEMQEMADLLDKLSDNIADVYASQAGGTRDEWRAAMRAESWYLAQEAVDAGLADEVAQSTKGADAPEMRKSFDLKAYGYTGGPQQPDPKGDAQQPAINVQVHIDGKAVAEQLIDPLRNLIRQKPAEAAAEGEVEVRGEHGPELVDLPEGQAIQPPALQGVADDDLTWDAMVAHLTEPEHGHWSELVAHLTDSTASSSAATDA
ncbi:head maturation protease, ClpP-related [Streptomyces sp. NPDC059718]